VADARTRRAKLKAMAQQSSSPREAEVAARILARLPGTISRDEILGTPDERANVGTKRIYDEHLRAWVVLDADEVV
jgi:hypothetical protein